MWNGGEIWSPYLPMFQSLDSSCVSECVYVQSHSYGSHVEDHIHRNNTKKEPKRARRYHICTVQTFGSSTFYHPKFDTNLI